MHTADPLSYVPPSFLNSFSSSMLRSIRGNLGGTLFLSESGSNDNLSSSSSFASEYDYSSSSSFSSSSSSTDSRGDGVGGGVSGGRANVSVDDFPSVRECFHFPVFP